MNTKLIIIAVVILVIVLVAWFLIAVMSGQQVGVQNQPGTDVVGDKTADISVVLSEVPDDASLNGEVDTLNQSVQSF